MIIGKEKLVADVVRRLENRALSVFVGAGLSCGCGGMTMAELCESFLGDVSGTDPSEYPDMLQSYLNDKNLDPGKFKKDVAGRLCGHEPGSRQEILARLPIRNYWTTNFDDLIERAVTEVDSAPAVMRGNDDFMDMEQRRDKIVYKLHGDVSSPEGIVILRDDYDRYHDEHKNFVLALSNELMAQSMFFLGYSMNDPDIDSITDTVKFIYNAEAPHYMILFVKDGTDKSEIDRKVRELSKKGIKNVCLISEYEELDDILGEIYRKFMARKVFISGSACDVEGGYGRYEKDEVRDMLKKIGFRLTDGFCDEMEYSLISGYGLDFGPSVMDGAAQAIVKHDMDFGKRLLIYPFPEEYYSTPEGKRTPDKRAEYRKYREKMIGRCGVAFFLIGLKPGDDGGLINAHGVEEEFDIAHEQKKYVFPIATGGESDVLAKKVMDDYTEYNRDTPEEVESLYKNLNRRLLSGEKVPTGDIIDGICDIMKFLTGKSGK